MNKSRNTAMPAMPSNAEAPLSRRSFLSLVTKSALALVGMLGLGGLARFLSFETQPAPPTQFDLGPAEAFTAEPPRLIPEAQAMVQRSGDKLTAISLVCPHLGCQVEAAAGQPGFACPCHGSRFGPSGAVERGPATEDLRQLPLTVDEDGRLILTTH